MSERARPIIIIGFMAAGKTTVAAALAERLGCRLVDLDQFVEQREGRSIRAIIDEEGEKAFREIESEALGEALKTDSPCIIALGGGYELRDLRAYFSELNLPLPRLSTVSVHHARNRPRGRRSAVVLPTVALMK